MLSKGLPYFSPCLPRLKEEGELLFLLPNGSPGQISSHEADETLLPLLVPHGFHWFSSAHDTAWLLGWKRQWFLRKEVGKELFLQRNPPLVNFEVALRTIFCRASLAVLSSDREVGPEGTSSGHLVQNWMHRCKLE